MNMELSLTFFFCQANPEGKVARQAGRPSEWGLGHFLYGTPKQGGKHFLYGTGTLPVKGWNHFLFAPRHFL